MALFAILGCPVDAATAALDPVASRPNILLIVADDLGRYDLGSSGNPLAHTPNLDQLAAQGLRFSRHYAESTCQPSRAALLTGRMASRVAQPTQFVGISPELTTLPEALKKAGYRTIHIGKWHLGEDTEAAWPSSQGFDEWFGFLSQFLLSNSESEDRVRYSYVDPWLQSDSTPRRQFQGHLTDILTERAVETIRAQKDSLQPWFLNLWYFAPHSPIEPHPRFAELYPETPEGRYLALVRQLDDGIGQVLNEIGLNGMADRTIVVFLSDNGGTNAETENNFPFRGTKGTFYEGALRTPLILRWRGVVPPGTNNDVVSEVDLFPTLAALTGAKVPADIDGIPLDLAGGASREGVPSDRGARSLYWELASPNLYSYSVLSGDGRWRLVNTELFDLIDDPAGKTNVASRHPEVLKRLTDQFLDWQARASRADVTFHRADPAQGELRGDSFRRIPGAGGYTLAIGVTPEQAPGEPQVILSHGDDWSIEAEAEATHLRIGKIDLSAPPLPPGRCSALVVSMYFNTAKQRPANRRAWFQVYLDDELVLQETGRRYDYFPRRFLEPTLIGHAPGRSEFAGRLSDPVVLNSFLGMKKRDDGKISRMFGPGGSPPSAKDILERLRNEVCRPEIP